MCRVVVVSTVNSKGPYTDPGGIPYVIGTFFGCVRPKPDAINDLSTTVCCDSNLVLTGNRARIKRDVDWTNQCLNMSRKNVP